jgi:hypothetical protein
VIRQLVDFAQTRHNPGAEGPALAGAKAMLIEDEGHLLVGMVVEQPVYLGNDLC